MENDDSDSLQMDFDFDDEDPVTSLRSRLSQSARHVTPMTSLHNRLGQSLSNDDPMMSVRSRLGHTGISDDPTTSLRTRLRHSPFPTRARPVSFPPAFTPPHNTLFGFRKQKLLDRTPQAIKPTHSVHADLAVVAQRCRKVKFADEAGKDLASYFEIPEHKALSDLGALLDNVIGEIEAEYEEKFGSRVPDVVPHVETIVPRRTIFDYLRGKEDSVLRRTRRRAHSCSPDRTSGRKELEPEITADFVTPVFNRSRSRECVRDTDKENIPQRPTRGILKRTQKPQKVKHKVETGDLFSLSQSNRRSSNTQFSRSTSHKSSFADCVETTVSTNQKHGFRLDSYKDNFDRMGAEQYTTPHLSTTGFPGHITAQAANATQQCTSRLQLNSSETTAQDQQDYRKAALVQNAANNIPKYSAEHRPTSPRRTGAFLSGNIDSEQGRYCGGSVLRSQEREPASAAGATVLRSQEREPASAAGATVFTYTPLPEGERCESPLAGSKVPPLSDKLPASAMDLHFYMHKGLVDPASEPVKPPSPSMNKDSFSIKPNPQGHLANHHDEHILAHLAHNDISAISAIDDGDLFKPISKLFKPSLGREPIRKPDFTDTGMLKHSSKLHSHIFPSSSNKIRKLQSMHDNNMPPGYSDSLCNKNDIGTTRSSEKLENKPYLNHNNEIPKLPSKFQKLSSPIREIRQVRILEKTVTIEETRYSPSVSRSNSIDEEPEPTDEKPVPVLFSDLRHGTSPMGRSALRPIPVFDTLREVSPTGSIELQPEVSPTGNEADVRRKETSSTGYTNVPQEEISQTGTDAELSQYVQSPKSHAFKSPESDRSNVNISYPEENCKNAPCDNLNMCDRTKSELELHSAYTLNKAEGLLKENMPVMKPTVNLECDNKKQDGLSFEMSLDIFENEYKCMVTEPSHGNANYKDNLSSTAHIEKSDNGNPSMEIYGGTCVNSAVCTSPTVTDPHATANSSKHDTDGGSHDTPRLYPRPEGQNQARDSPVNPSANVRNRDNQNNVEIKELESNSCSTEAGLPADNSCVLESENTPLDSSISSILNNNLEYDTPHISDDTDLDDYTNEVSNLKYISEDLNNFPFGGSGGEQEEDENANVPQIEQAAGSPSPRCSTSSVDSLDAFNTSSDDMFLAQIHDTCLAEYIPAVAEIPAAGSPLSFDYHFCLDKTSNHSNSSIVGLIQEDDVKPDTPEETFTLSPPLQDYYSIVPRSMSDSLSSDDVSELTYVLPQAHGMYEGQPVFRNRAVRRQSAGSDDECIYLSAHSYGSLNASHEAGNGIIGCESLNSSVESFEDCGTVVSRDSDSDSRHSGYSDSQADTVSSVHVSDFTRVAVHECDYCASDDTNSCHDSDSDEDEILSISIDSGSEQHLSSDQDEAPPSAPTPPPDGHPPISTHEQDASRSPALRRGVGLQGPPTICTHEQEVPRSPALRREASLHGPPICSAHEEEAPSSAPPLRREARMRGPMPNRLKRHRRSLSSDDIVHFRHYADTPSLAEESAGINGSNEGSVLSLDKLNLKASRSDNKLLDYVQNDTQDMSLSARHDIKRSTSMSASKKRCSGRRGVRARRCSTDSEPESEEGEKQSCCPWIRSASHIPTRTAPLPTAAAATSAKQNPHTRAMRKFLDSSSNPSLVYNRRGSALSSGCLKTGYSNHGASFCDDFSLNTPCSHTDCLPKFT